MSYTSAMLLNVEQRQEMPPDMPNVVVFGPGANCTLEICPVEWSVYKYRPSLAANLAFLILYTLLGAIHTYLGWRWRRWWFAAFMIIGCVSEVAGYTGRLLLWNNPFSFPGFMLQITCVTGAPVFFTAAIYITLSQTIEYFAPEISRFRPKLFYWVFIPADIVCLILQGAGGALSTVSQGVSQIGIDLAMVGLILQVVMIFGFCALFADYMILYFRSSLTRPLVTREKLFFSFLMSAIVIILGRCLFRCYELSEGYSDSDLISDEGLFIGLEGVLIIIAVICLFIGHPGFIFHGVGQAKNNSINSASGFELESVERTQNDGQLTS